MLTNSEKPNSTLPTSGPSFNLHKHMPPPPTGIGLGVTVGSPVLVLLVKRYFREIRLKK